MYRFKQSWKSSVSQACFTSTALEFVCFFLFSLLPEGEKLRDARKEVVRECVCTWRWLIRLIKMFYKRLLRFLLSSQKESGAGSFRA